MVIKNIKMKHKDRFLATISNSPVDKPASWLGLPVPSAEPALKKYFGVKSMNELKTVIDDDIYPIEVPYNFAPSNHIACAFNFAKVSHLDKPDERTLTAPGFFEDYENPLDIDKFPWPDPADPRLFEGLVEKAREFYHNGYAVILESISAGIFEMSCRSRGTQYFLMDMALNPELACKLMDKYVDIKIRFYEAAEELGQYIQFIREGDDVAGQDSLLMSADMYRRLVKPRHEKIIKTQKEIFPQPFYAFFHSDGQVYDLLPDFIEIGIDILNPVQITSKSLDDIKREFGSELSFWGGGCDTQRVLPFGTPEAVKSDVKQRIEHLSPGGGFIFCTVHNIQADVPPENIMAMYETLKKYGRY